jgi:DNA-binding protein HU-beta
MSMQKTRFLQGEMRVSATPNHLRPDISTVPEASTTPRSANMAKKATPTTVTLKHLAAAIAEDQELSKKQAETILNDTVTLITKHLKKGERIRIVGLGILQVRKRAARMGRNPATGEAIHIKASKKVAFRAAKELKEAI